MLQRRALHPKAQHLLHRQINRIIPVRGHVSAAAAARVLTPLYRIAALGFRRRHGGDRGLAWGMRGGSPPRRSSPLPVPLLRLDVRLRYGKGRAAGWSVHPRRCGGHDGGMAAEGGSAGRAGARWARPTSASLATGALKGPRLIWGATGGGGAGEIIITLESLCGSNKRANSGVCTEMCEIVWVVSTRFIYELDCDSKDMAYEFIFPYHEWDFILVFFLQYSF